MADNKQNPGTENTRTGNTQTGNTQTGNTQSGTNDKTMSGGSSASTRQAKEGTNAPGNFANKPTAPAAKPTAPAGNADSVKDTFNKVKESTGEITSQALGQAKEKASSVIDEQKTNVATGLTGVADSIRQISENIGGDENNQITALAGKYGDNLAGQVEKLSGYIEDKNFKELARDVEQFARRNPALFVAGAFALGILAARFLKSSDSGQTSRKRLGKASSETSAPMKPTAQTS